MLSNNNATKIAIVTTVVFVQNLVRLCYTIILLVYCDMSVSLISLYYTVCSI